MLKTDRQVLLQSRPESVRSLYDRYAGMLLGYIFEIIGDSKLAEELLVRIFCELSEELSHDQAQGPQNWSQLQRFAKGKLAAFAVVPGNVAINELSQRRSGDQQLAALSEEQKRVFLAIYYHGRKVGVLAAELNRTEEFIRKTLTEAFAILRKSGEN
jgi:DNA-directed RNA polymerase specialized sigma24 family protein